MKYLISSEQELLEVGAKLAQACHAPCIIFLTGELGAGKTTFVRGFLKQLGYQSNIKSPTYTLVESYQLNGQKIFHFDLYRITNPEELEFIGIRDYFSESAIFLIEWPECGVGMLPQEDLVGSIGGQNGEKVILFAAKTDAGKSVLQKLIGA